MVLRTTSVIAFLMCLSLPAGCTVDVDEGRTDDRARRIVWVNALAVANPDYRVIHEKIQRPERRDSRSIDIQLEARWPIPGVTLPTRGRRDAVLTGTRLGGVEAPRLTSWRLTELLQGLGSGDGQKDVKEAASRLEALKGAEVRVLAVIEFKKPLPERDVRIIWPYQIDVGLFSPGRPMPISWDQSGYCDSRGFDACKLGIKDSLAKEFSEWVGMLTSADRTALDSFGLDLAELEESAQRGLYHGMILNAYPERVIPLTKLPEILSVKIADVALAGQ
ncbi:hypothetical protein ACWDRB_52465 [Nonomuraea sp. NPDC003707]